VNFRPELAAMVMAGTKTVTRRVMSSNPRSPWFEGGCKLVVGRDYAVCPGRGREQLGRVRCIGVSASTMGAVDDAEARREGCADAAAFRALIERIHGSFDPDLKVWRIEMEQIDAWLAGFKRDGDEG
jgi:uncharacterized protein YhfF